ncbi:MAG: hypothetical protein ACRBCS_02635 [Cellvibrionaceae bacterium]
MEEKLLKEIIDKINSNISIEKLGVFEKKISNKIDTYSPKLKEIEKIVVFYQDDKSIKKINFVSKKPLFSIEYLKKELGDFKTGYSFRDDITKISFETPSNVIKQITTTKDNRLEISQEKIMQITPQGEIFEYKPSDKIFTSICFILKY